MNGPCGVGKTSISKCLAKMFPKSAHIRADDIRNFITDMDLSSKQNDLLDLNIYLVVKNIMAFGVNTVIIDNIYETQKHIMKVLTKLKKLDKNIHCIRILCDLDENITRNSQRKVNDIMPTKRVEELYDIFAHDEYNIIWKVFNTTKQDEFLSAKTIYEFICSQQMYNYL
jgi:tRNA uridine 5-carbamoylmethylation protein Kti12